MSSLYKLKLKLKIYTHHYILLLQTNLIIETMLLKWLNFINCAVDNIGVIDL